MENHNNKLESLLMLREQMEKGGYLSKQQAWALQHSMLELGFKAAELDALLSEEILPAAHDGDEHRLYKALMAYDLKLWEIQEFRYIVMARRALGKAILKLSEKIYPDEE